MSTKLGPHVLRGAPDLSEYIQAGIAVAKFVGEWGMARDVPDGVLVIGRRHEGNYDAQYQRAIGQTPLEAAQQFVQDQLPTYQSNPHIEYWEGHNEPVWTDEEGMGWYGQFEVERMRLMFDLGLKCVIGNFATGTPDLSLWPTFLPALQIVREYQALLGLHESSCPWMWWMTGRYQPGPNADEGDEGWTTLRYRKVYRQHLIPNGLGNVPLVITECGIDPAVNPKPPGVTGGTWKHLGDFWAQHDNEPDKADYYFRQLVWYDEELQKDDYVVGATIFTWGSFGAPWSDFDVAGTEVAKKLIAYTQGDPAKPFEYPGVGEQGEGEAEEPRGHPRVQYARRHPRDQYDRNSGTRSTKHVQPKSLQAIIEEKIRLDVAVPKTVAVNHTFEIAVAIRQPDSALLDAEGLPKTTSASGRVFRSVSEDIVRYRVTVSAPDCEVHIGEYVFLLRSGSDSEVCFFQLTAKRAGDISILVQAYQEDDVLAAMTRVQLVASLEARDASWTANEDQRAALTNELRVQNKLYNVLNEAFSLEDLEVLCFQLGVDWDQLEGSAKPKKVRELIQFFERQHQTDVLITAVQSKRPYLAPLM